MEPFKALTLVVAAAVVSLVGAGAAGFYAGYSAGRGNLDEIKAHIASVQQPVLQTGEGGAVSLKPVIDDIRALSKQVDALASAKAAPAASNGDVNLKPVLEEIKALSGRIDGLKAEGFKAQTTPAPATVLERPAGAAPDYSETLRDIREQVHTLNVKLEKQEPKAPKALFDDIRALGASIAAAPNYSESIREIREQVQALSVKLEKQEPKAPKALFDDIRALGASMAAAPNYSESIREIRDQVQALSVKLEKQEPKAPKALVEDIRALSASIQAQESNTRRVVGDEVRQALQAAEPKVSKTLMDEIRTISANVRALDQRPQVSIVDQLKVLQASVEGLKAKLAEEERGRGDSAGGADVAQLRQLLSTASDQFGKCQTHLAALANAGAPASPAPATTIAVSQTPRQEPSAVVFYDNVMLKKDQEKQYDEIGVRLALQSVGSRQVRVAVNRQPFGLAFGERKVFRSQDVECEINLMETNLNDSQARVSLSCKR
jgi:hypothetical protein